MAQAMQRPSKAARWQSILHTGRTSLTGLHKIIGRIQEIRDVGERTGRNCLLAANTLVLDSCVATDNLDVSHGEAFKWEFANPNLLLPRLLEGSDALQECYAAALRRHPNDDRRQWTAIIAFDEFAVGDKLKPRNRRKTMLVSYSFLELGGAALSHELVWNTFAAIRTVEIKRVRGGWPFFLKKCLHLFLTNELAMAQVGVPITIHGQHHLLYAAPRRILSDLDGLRAGLDWLGSSSHRPCPLKCCNVWRKGMECIDGEVDITESDASKFSPLTKETLADVVDLVIAAEAQQQNGDMTMTAFKDLRASFGVHANTLGVLADEDLRVLLDIPKCVRTDWVHDTCAAKSLFSNEMHCFIKVCARHGIEFARWGELMKSDWCFPKALQVKKSKLYELFGQYGQEYQDKNDAFKAKASDYVSLYLMMRYTCEKRLHLFGELDEERMSFEAACVVMDLLLNIKRSPDGDKKHLTDQLRHALRRHHELHVDAYGTRYWTPKGHATKHVPDQVDEDGGILLEMFVVERLNLRQKGLADLVSFTGRYEYSVLASLLTLHKNQAREASSLSPGLLGPRVPLDDAPHVTLAKAIKVEGREFHHGDIVFHSSESFCGCVLAAAEENRHLYVIVQPLLLVGDVLPHSAQYRLSDTVRTLKIGDAIAAGAWFNEDNGDYVVLR